MELWFTEKITDHTHFSIRVKEQLFHGKSDFQTVDVYETNDFGRVMTIDGKFMVTERDEFIYHDMIAHVPLLAHPEPKRVLIIGGGDGGTLREVLKHESVEYAEMCEIDGLVIDVARQYFPDLSCEFDNPRAKISVCDGIEYINNVTEPFDVILVDSTDPAGPATGLFNSEFYKSVHAALSDDGVMVAQSEGPLWDLKLVQGIVSTISETFQEVQLYTFPVPTYPLGFWSFTFASKSFGPFEHYDSERAAHIAANARYYNEDIHKAAFAMPNFVKHKSQI